MQREAEIRFRELADLTPIQRVLYFSAQAN
jgi:hypothetical protein